MKRRFAWLLVGVPLLLVCACSKNESPKAKPQPVADKPQETGPKEAESKSPTPEGAGMVVVSPLADWMQQAKPVQAEVTRPYEAQRIDTVVSSPWEKPKNFLHTVFSVKSYAQFEFVIPPRKVNPRLHGSFRSFAKRADPDSSDKTADVDLMVLNEQEFNDFVHNRPGSTTYQLDPSHDQVVDYAVPATHGQAQKYHLVFHNSDGGTKIKFIEADFTVSSD